MCNVAQGVQVGDPQASPTEENFFVCFLCP